MSADDQDWIWLPVLAAGITRLIRAQHWSKGSRQKVVRGTQRRNRIDRHQKPGIMYSISPRFDVTHLDYSADALRRGYDSCWSIGRVLSLLILSTTSSEMNSPLITLPSRKRWNVSSLTLQYDAIGHTVTATSWWVEPPAVGSSKSSFNLNQGT